MNKKLPIEKIMALTHVVADHLAITLPDDAVMAGKLNLQNPHPLVVKSNFYTLWIDRYYIAYSHDDEHEIHYVYLTEHHIKEEMESYLDAKGASSLPGHIEQQFRYAYQNMAEHEKKFWIFNRQAAGGESIS
ncbi:MAG TPA: hypothetical protein P5309_08830 [Syntrophomonadaceae bacterium]|nr:hypothetical protein [Syntrophomonadaceae bacterium]